MMKNTSITNMTQGKPLKLILIFALPLMAGNIFQQLYTVTDTAIVGKALGVNALAALGVVDCLNWMILGIVQCITQGFSILVSQKFGLGDYKQMRKIIGNACTMAFILSLIICIIALLTINPAVRILRCPEEIMHYAVNYLRVMFLGIPVMMAYNLASAILRALGDSKTPLYAMVFASITNIILDLIFVLSFRWGVQGAALATIIAQILSTIYCLIIINKIDLLKLNREDFNFKTNIAQHLLNLAAPMAFQNIIIAIGGMIVQVVVNGFGVAFIAGFTATNKLYGVLEVAATSYGYAMVTYTGQNIGAGEKERVEKGVKAGLIIGIITSLIITLLMFICGKIILSCFIQIEEANGPLALEIAYKYLKIMSAFLPILYILHIIRSTIQGMGNTMVPMISGIFELIMRTASSLILPTLFYESGIMFAEVIAWAGANVILIPGYIKEKNK